MPWPGRGSRPVSGRELARVADEPGWSADDPGWLGRRLAFAGLFEHPGDLGDVDDVELEGAGARRLDRLRAVSAYDSQWAAMEAVAKLLGIGSAETVRTWVRRDEVDGGRRPGVTTDAAAELARLKRENAELRRANEILKAAAAFFGAELDRPGRR